MPEVVSTPPVQQPDQTDETDTPPLEGDPEEGSDIEPDVVSTPPAQQPDQTDETDTPAASGSDPDDAIRPTKRRVEALGSGSVVVPEPVTVTAPVAFAVAPAALPPAPGTPEWQFFALIQRAVNRLAIWPGVPRNFVYYSNNPIDRSLDTANDQLDDLAVNAPPGSPARWLPDLLNIMGAFFVPAVPNTTFSDALNAMGDFLNRIVPPFRISSGAGTFDIITPYKIMGAAVVGTATVLQDMLNGIYDPAQWAIHVIKSTTGATVTQSDLTDFNSLSGKVVAAQAAALLGGDGGAFNDPSRVWQLTLPTWTAAQTNPFTIVTYVAFVAMYKRFQEMAFLTTFTTSTTYDSWHYATPGFGLYAAGTFHAVDSDGNPVTFPAGGSLGATYISQIGGATVTVNTVEGGFTYTPWFQSAAFLHRSTSENPEDRYDTVRIPVRSADGVEYTLTFKIEIVGGSNANPTATHTVGGADALGVVRGKVTGSDPDGDTMTYSLVGSSVNGLNGNSAQTKNGNGNGGIVTINPTTGDFTYISSGNAGATQSFQVRVSDGHNGSVIRTITVPNVTQISAANVDTSTQYVVKGTPPGFTSVVPGGFTSYALGAGPSKGTVTAFDPTTGAFTYVRNSSLGHTTTVDDVVTVIATDAAGLTVTLRLAVAPAVPNTAPTLTLTTPPTVGTLTGSTSSGSSTSTQTTTGKVTYSDADGDTAVWPPSVTSLRGGTVTFAPDGTFTYTNTMTRDQRHAVAKIGAAGTTYNGVALAAYEDAFIATVSDGYGGTAQVTVKVAIYAYNTRPTTQGTYGAVWANNVTVVGARDADGDTLTYTWSSGSSFTGDYSANTGTRWGVSRPVSLTVHDGHYKVTNGVVDTSAAGVTRTWTAAPSIGGSSGSESDATP
ncbi:MAG: Ig-like domain-containing protein [Mycobacterium sp.]